jgi:hypothetical protein
MLAAPIENEKRGRRCRPNCDRLHKDIEGDQRQIVDRQELLNA